MKIGRALSTLRAAGGMAIGWGWQRRKGIGAALGGLAVLLTIIGGVNAFIFPLLPSAPGADIEDVTAELSVVNRTADDVMLSNWVQYSLAEFYPGRIAQSPRVSSRVRLPNSDEPLDREILLKPGDKVVLLLDITVDKATAAVLDRGAAELLVIAHLSSGQPLVNSVPFQRDTLRDFYLELSIEDER